MFYSEINVISRPSDGCKSIEHQPGATVQSMPGMECTNGFCALDRGEEQREDQEKEKQAPWFTRFHREQSSALIDLLQ